MHLKLSNLARLLLRVVESTTQMERHMEDARRAKVGFASYIEATLLFGHEFRNELYVFMQCHSEQEILHMLGAVEEVRAA